MTKIFKKILQAQYKKFMNFFLKKNINSIVKKNYSKNIVFSGGCALNSSANKFITDKDEKFEKFLLIMLLVIMVGH